MEIDQNTIYYFCSTAAQVWAALVAFGGLALRDRLLRSISSQDELFKLTILNLRYRDAFNDAYPGAKGGTFLEKQRFIKFMANHQNFEGYQKKIQKVLPTSHLDFENDSTDSVTGTFRAAADYFSGLLREVSLESRIRRSLRITMAGAATLIILALIGIPVSKWLLEHRCWFWRLVATEMIGSAIFYWVLADAFRD